MAIFERVQTPTRPMIFGYLLVSLVTAFALVVFLFGRSVLAAEPETNGAKDTPTTETESPDEFAPKNSEEEAAVKAYEACAEKLFEGDMTEFDEEAEAQLLKCEKLLPERILELVEAEQAVFEAFDRCADGVFAELDGDSDFSEAAALELEEKIESECLPLLPAEEQAHIKEMQPFDECLDEHLGTETDLDEASFEDAVSKCEHLLPEDVTAQDFGLDGEAFAVEVEPAVAEGPAVQGDVVSVVVG